MQRGPTSGRMTMAANITAGSATETARECAARNPTHSRLNLGILEMSWKNLAFTKMSTLCKRTQQAKACVTTAHKTREHERHAAQAIAQLLYMFRMLS